MKTPTTIKLYRHNGEEYSFKNSHTLYGKQESRSFAEASDELHLLETETARFASKQHMKSLLTHYKMHQTTVREETILSIEATRTDRFLKHMLYTGGVNLKFFWNIKRKICQSMEDLTAIIEHQGNRPYHSNEILNYTAKYYEDLYTPKFPSYFTTEWNNIILADISTNKNRITSTMNKHLLTYPYNEQKSRRYCQFLKTTKVAVRMTYRMNF